MANPSKAQDPAAAALSAIEEALNLGEHADVVSPLTAERAGDGKSEARTFELSSDDRMHPLLSPGGTRRDNRARLPSAENDTTIFGRTEPAALPEPTISPEPPAGAIEAPALDISAERRIPAAERIAPLPPVAPANDDKESVGAILRTLQARPSGTPMIVAGLAAVLWIAVCAIYVYADRGEFAGSSLFTPKGALVLLAIVGPLLFFFMTAALVRRTQEVRLTARSMLQVAVRLAEPEAIATEQMVTLGQAIRREIASMGDGIERALARAGELETLVRSEVSNIERSFGDNERRVRSLIDELSSEREAIVGNAEKVRGAIAGAHDTLSRDLEGIQGALAVTLAEAGERVAATLGGKGEEIRVALIGAGDSLTSNIGASGEDLVARLKATTDGVASAIDERTDAIEGKLAAAGRTLVADLGLRADSIVARLDETGNRISDQIVTRGDNLAARLAETGDRLHDVVANHGNELHGHLGEMGERIAGMIGERTDAARQLLDQSHDNLSGLLEESHGKVHARFEDHGAA